MTALVDGGFIVACQTNENDDDVFFQVVKSGGPDTAVPQATLLEDGLVALTFTLGNDSALVIVATEALDVVLTGGGGNDSFVFVGDFGNDVITDFAAANNEDIDLSAVAENVDFADLMANHMTQVGDDVLIDDGIGNTITIQDFDINNLQNGDFVF